MTGLEKKMIAGIVGALVIILVVVLVLDFALSGLHPPVEKWPTTSFVSDNKPHKAVWFSQEAGVPMGTLIYRVQSAQLRICGLCEEEKLTLPHPSEGINPFEAHWLCRKCHQHVHNSPRIFKRFSGERDKLIVGRL